MCGVYGMQSMCDIGMYTCEWEQAKKHALLLEVASDKGHVTGTGDVECWYQETFHFYSKNLWIVDF